MVSPCLKAQKKELSQARSYIKSGKDLNKAEDILKKLLQNPDNRLNKKIYLLWLQAVEKQYAAGNEKLYLKEKYDTAALFNQAYQMLQIIEMLDSIDALPDDKGKVKPEYRKKHSEMMVKLRPNIYFGGTYYIRKGNYNQGFMMLDAYLDCHSQPLFSSSLKTDNDKHYTDAAYWATYCGYKTNDSLRILKYADIALRDSARMDYTLQYMAEAYVMLSDTASYVNTLNEGFKHYPEHRYFFPRLVEFYNHYGYTAKTEQLITRAMEVNDSNQLFLFAKSTFLLNNGRYDECIETTERLIAINDSLAEAYFNIATAYLNKLLPLEDQPNAKRDKKTITALYEQACKYMETFRLLAPKEENKWAAPLYRIYLNLNMGKEFEEIDRLLQKNKKNS